MMMRKRRTMRRLMACVAAVFMLSGCVITQADTAEALDAGDVATVSFDGYLKGVEGKYYTMDLNGSVLFYNSDGSTYVQKVSGKKLSKRRHMILTDKSSGEVREGYCVEFDAELKARTTYTGSGYMTDKIYFQNLPEDVKKLILATTYYGRNEKNPLPVSGVNSEDYYFATQMMIWEVQQQIRVFTRDADGRITGTKRVAAHGMQEDFFYRYIKGRAAQKCYDFIVENMSKHFVTPDFVGETAQQADPVTLKYSMITKKWHGSASDKTGEFSMKWSVDDITYSQSGTSHNFTSDKAISGERTIKVKRKTDEGSSAENLLIWNNNTNQKFQVVATGSASPPEFFMRLKTDVPAEVSVQKVDAETGKAVALSGTEYRVKNVALNKYVSTGMKDESGEIYRTDRDGKLTIGEKLQAGDYILEEVKAPKGYVVASEPLAFTVDGETAEFTVKQKNAPQMGIITITKMGEYKHNDRLDDIRERAMGGIDFDIIALDDIVTADGTVRAKKGEVVDTVRTDFNGNVSSKKLYLGPYNVVEKDAPVEYRISEPINVALIYGDQEIEVVEKKINVFNRLKRETDSFGDTPLTGDETDLSTPLLVMLLSLTVMCTAGIMFRLAREDER